jgi:hypothetical protein
MIRFSKRFVTSLLTELSSRFNGTALCLGGYPLSLYFKDRNINVETNDIDVFLPTIFHRDVRSRLDTLFGRENVEETTNNNVNYEGDHILRTFRIRSLQLNIIVIDEIWSNTNRGVGVTAVFNTFDLDICKIALNSIFDHVIISPPASSVIHSNLLLVPQEVTESRYVKYRDKLINTNIEVIKIR